MSEEKKICTRCGYLRKPEDDHHVPQTECPKCGVIYHKFEGGLLAFDFFIDQKRSQRKNRKRSKKMAYVLTLFLVFMAIFFAGFISGRAYSKLEIVNAAKNSSQVIATDSASANTEARDIAR